MHSEQSLDYAVAVDQWRDSTTRLGTGGLGHEQDYLLSDVGSCWKHKASSEDRGSSAAKRGK